MFPNWKHKLIKKRNFCKNILNKKKKWGGNGGFWEIICIFATSSIFKLETNTIMKELKGTKTEKNLQEAGVISGYDQTVESAVTKLMFLQSHYPEDPNTVRRLMVQSLRGEITR